MANSRVEYTIHDHLGSPRVILSDLNGDGTISTSNMEVLDRYVNYPFGMEAESHLLHGIPTTNEERYGSKERSAAAHAEILDYEARYYEPSIGRFMGVDPLASDFPSQSSYLYAYNNPVRMIDVDGLYGDENEANRQRDLAQAQGHKVVGDVYKSGDEWMFNTMEGDAFTGRFDNDFSRNSAKSFASGIIEKLIEQPIDAMLNVSTSIGGHLIDRARIILAEGPHEGPAFNEENDLSTPRLRFDFDNPNWVYQENNIETDMHTNEIARDQIKVLTSIPVGGLYGIPVKFGVNFLFQKSIEKGLNEKMKTP